MDDRDALKKAKEELQRIDYLLELGMLNRGLYQIYARRHDWLIRIIYLAEKQIERNENNGRL